MRIVRRFIKVLVPRPTRRLLLRSERRARSLYISFLAKTPIIGRQKVIRVPSGAPLRRTLGRRNVQVPDATKSSRPFRRVIWAYWHDGAPPVVVTRCLERIETIFENYEIRVLSYRNISEWLDNPDVPDVKRHGVALLSDWLRLELLAKYGGVWIDASTLIWPRLARQLEQVDFGEVQLFGFWNEKSTENDSAPVIESWFLAATAGSHVVVGWRDELRKIVDIGAEEYLRDALKKFGESRILQNIRNPTYLIVYIALQVVYCTCRETIEGTIVSAQRSGLFIQERYDWSIRGRTIAFRRHRYSDLRNFLAVKLTAEDRLIFECNICSNKYREGSLIASLMDEEFL